MVFLKIVGIQSEKRLYYKISNECLKTNTSTERYPDSCNYYTVNLGAKIHQKEIPK